MSGHLVSDAWSVIEEGFDPSWQKACESIFSIGNGHMGQRANFEECYSGETLRGSYIAGIYYPDKTRVGWWKNGYPEYFAKVLNSPNWIGIDVTVDAAKLDLAKFPPDKFRRELNMKDGLLARSFEVKLAGDKRIRVEAVRFVSMADPEIAVIRYAVTALDDIALTLAPYLDGDVKNEDANYDEQFWEILQTECGALEGAILAQTRKLGFRAAFAMQCRLETGCAARHTPYKTPAAAGNVIATALKAGTTVTLCKYVAVTTSLDHDADTLLDRAREKASAAALAGFDVLCEAHKARWAGIWRHSDIVIDGDVEAQQGIRFNIFHLNQTYTGEDERLNVGPKGFTGEKYGGSTYWDTEAFCIPFFLSTAPRRVSRNLLVYRYKHLGKAIENAARLGFGGGAALYPMVTMNGEECHNEWEITFEEVHRNGAIAFAIYNYIRHTGDEEYLAEYGLEVLIAIARFWSQRATFSEDKGKYVILGVTGPNEYENNVNNNWYTNTIACWCMDYAGECLSVVERNWPGRHAEITAKTGFKGAAETDLWRKIVAGMYFPYDDARDICLQQDGYLDKEQTPAAALDPAQRPINQHWSWDRILRSPYIKQADTLQGLYLFEERYDTEFIRRHFEFYESRTVHESSLSPCIHSILAARIGDVGKAYELYLRTSRLDLDDYNHEVDEGLHITSMAGTWMSVVEGFGGKRMRDGKLHLNPIIHRKWRRYSFHIVLHDRPLLVTVTKDGVTILYKGDRPSTVNVYGEDRQVVPGQVLEIRTPEIRTPGRGADGPPAVASDGARAASEVRQRLMRAKD